MNLFIKLKYLLLEFIDLGLVGGIYRIGYECGWRSGLFEFLEKRKGKKILNKKIDLSLSEWKKSIKLFFVDGFNPQVKSFLQSLPQNEKQRIIEIADQSLNGRIFCFSKWFANYGSPINWHLNPVKNLHWQKDLHWSKEMKYTDGGDIKLVWEVNRFPHVYYLVRAYYLTGDSKYVNGFINQIHSWTNQNPYLMGVNWASGQELAIRLLAWIFGLYNFYKSEQFVDKDFEILVKQIYLHTQHISNNIHYAYYAVHNNHLIGEALALYIVGTLFPCMPDSEKWKKKGRKILIGRSLEQFYNDGGYCQLSHTYHRLALHYFLWAIRIGELNGDRFPETVYDVLKQSADYLYQNMNLLDGKLPNWGNNDGALFNPWTCCDFSDFRPIITSIYRICGKESPFPEGTWDEESMWLLGNINEGKYKSVNQKSQSYMPTGLHILRQNEKNYCVFRCGTPKDRFGQADQLHLDIFFDGHNIVSDAGSYLYNDKLRYHKYFMGTLSHNTLTIDNQDQMLLWRRFKWLYKSKAKLLKFDVANKIVSGEHYGYHRIDKGLIHKRKVILELDKIIVKDELFNRNNNLHEFKLHWNLNVEKVSQIANNKFKSFKIYTHKKYYWFYIWSTNKDEPGEISLRSGYDDNHNVCGWLSRYYGEKKEIYRVNYILQNNHSNVMCSVFSKIEMNEQELYKCEFY